MAYEFRWNAWNVEHIGEHGVTRADAERVVNNARRPYPQAIGDDKRLVIGRTGSGGYIQAIYIFDPPGVVFVIHARPLTAAERKRYRRRTR